MINVFISYASEDRRTAESAFSFLQKYGFRPWMDKKNLVPGTRWEKAITDALLKSDVCLFLLSSTSTQKRGFFQREINLALGRVPALLENDISIIPVRLDECDVPSNLLDFQYYDLFLAGNWTGILPALRLAAEQRGKISELAQSSHVKEYVQLSEESTEKNYSFNGSYPRFYFQTNEPFSFQLNAIHDGIVNGRLVNFRGTMQEWDSTYPTPSSYSVSVEPITFVGDLISIATNSSWFYSGAAHGMYTLTAENFEVSSGTKIGNIFTNHDPIISRVHDIISTTGWQLLCRPEDLERTIMNAILKAGYFEGRDFVVHFAPYELFPYALGAFSARVPVSEIVAGKFGALHPRVFSVLLPLALQQAQDGP